MKAILLFFVLFAQEDPARPIRDQIERLSSERIEERERAVRTLRGLGQAALPELKRAVLLKDPEIVARVRRLLEALELESQFSAEFRQRNPGLVDRLMDEGDGVWKDAFLSLFIGVNGSRPPEKPPRSDFERLALRAVGGCSTPMERQRVSTQIQKQGLRSAIPGLLRWLEDADPSSRILGVQTLGALGAQERAPATAPPNPGPKAGPPQWSALIHETFPAIAARVADENGQVQQQALRTLQQLCPDETPSLLLGLLEQAAPEVRGSIVSALGTLRAPGSAPTFRRLADDPDPQVREASLRGLGALGSPTDLPLMIQHLKDAQAGVRSAAASTLSSMNANGALPEILALLGDPDESVRSLVASIAGWMSARSAVPLLIKALEDPASAVRRSAVGALGELDAHEALEALVRRLDDSEEEVRTTAIRAVACVGRGETAPRLLKMLEDTAEGVRQASVEAMKELGFRPAVPALVKALADASAELRKSLVSALGALGGAEAVRELVRLGPTDSDASRALENFTRGELWPVISPMLKSSDAGTRRSAAQAARIGEVLQAIPDLIPLLDDPDPQIRLEAVQAQEFIHSAGSIPGLLRRLAKEESPEIRAQAARVLGQWRPKSALPELMELLHSPDPKERLTAAEALVPLGIQEAKDVSLKLLREDSAVIQSQAVWIVASAGLQEAVPDLLRFLESEPLRMAGIYGLSAMKIAKAWPKIASLTEDENSLVRICSARALGVMETQEAVPALIRLLDDAEPNVRHTALQSLEQLKASEAIPALLRLAGQQQQFHLSPASVAKIGGKACVAPMLNWLGEAGDHRLFALGVLSGVPARESPEATPAILPLLRDDDPSIRGAAAAAAGKRGAREAIPTLVRLLEDVDGGVRGSALQALTDVRATAARGAVSRLLGDPEPMNRCRAASLLGSIGAKESIPGIRKLLGEGPAMGLSSFWSEARNRGREDVRWTAVRALGRMGDREGLAEIRPLLGDVLPALRIQAASWMCRLGSKEGAALLLAEADHLSSLNALRQPRIWAGLEAKELAEDHEGTLREILELLAAAAGLRLEASPEVVARDEAWQRVRCLTRILDEGATLADVLESVLSDEFDAILETDRIRIVTREEGLPFWQGWWKNEGNAK